MANEVMKSLFGMSSYEAEDALRRQQMEEDYKYAQLGAKERITFDSLQAGRSVGRGLNQMFGLVPEQLQRVRGREGALASVQKRIASGELGVDDPIATTKALIEALVASGNTSDAAKVLEQFQENYPEWERAQQSKQAGGVTTQVQELLAHAETNFDALTPEQRLKAATALRHYTKDKDILVPDGLGGTVSRTIKGDTSILAHYPNLAGFLGQVAAPAAATPVAPAAALSAAVATPVAAEPAALLEAAAPAVAPVAAAEGGWQPTSGTTAPLVTQPPVVGAPLTPIIAPEAPAAAVQPAVAAPAVVKPAPVAPVVARPKPIFPTIPKELEPQKLAVHKELVEQYKAAYKEWADAESSAQQWTTEQRRAADAEADRSLKQANLALDQARHSFEKKKEGGKIGEQMTSKNQALSSVVAARDLLDQGIYTGIYAGIQQNIVKALPVAFDKAKAARTETYVGYLANVVLPALKDIGGNDTEAERKYIEKLVGGTVQLEEPALRALLSKTEEHIRKHLAKLAKDQSDVTGDAPQRVYQIGDTVNVKGKKYRFIGGDHTKQSSWREMK